MDESALAKISPDRQAMQMFLDDDDDLLPRFQRIDSADIVYQEKPTASFIGNKYLKVREISFDWDVWVLFPHCINVIFYCFSLTIGHPM